MFADETGSLKVNGKRVDYRVSAIKTTPGMDSIKMRMGRDNFRHVANVWGRLSPREMLPFARDLFAKRAIAKLKTRRISSAARSTVDVYKVEWVTPRHGTTGVNIVAENGADAKAKVSKVTSIPKSEMYARRIWKKGMAPMSSFTAVVIR